MPNPTEIKRAAVLGYPVNHSLSPRLHNYWLKQYNIKGSYEAIAVEPQMLAQTLRTLPEQGFVGVNITIPHKEKALEIVDEADETAKRIGAVNTIVMRGDTLWGTNTDEYGFFENLRVHGCIPDAKTSVLIIGVGGATRAICAGLVGRGCRITLTNRSQEKAERFAQTLNKNVHVAAWEDRQKATENISLLINATPLGMQGQPPLDLSLEKIPRDAVVTDIVYAPRMTPLLEQAQLRGNPIITGLGMLLYQAQPAFEYWFGIKPEVTPELTHYMQEALA